MVRKVRLALFIIVGSMLFFYQCPCPSLCDFTDFTVYVTSDSAQYIDGYFSRPMDSISLETDSFYLVVAEGATDTSSFNCISMFRNIGNASAVVCVPCLDRFKIEKLYCNRQFTVDGDTIYSCENMIGNSKLSEHMPRDGILSVNKTKISFEKGEHIFVVEGNLDRVGKKIGKGRLTFY